MPQMILCISANKDVTGLVVANTVWVTNKLKILRSGNAVYLNVTPMQKRPPVFTASAQISCMVQWLK